MYNNEWVGYFFIVAYLRFVHIDFLIVPFRVIDYATEKYLVQQVKTFQYIFFMCVCYVGFHQSVQQTNI